MSIRIDNVDVYVFEAAIRGMRSPKNSWDKSDSCWSSPNENGTDKPMYIIGENDLKLMKTLAAAGQDHGKFLRMMPVQLDVTAPLYWWKEADQYKVGTVTDSCSTMHKIHAKEFELDDFSHEHIINSVSMVYQEIDVRISPMQALLTTIECLNSYRELYLETKDKKYWWQLIQLLPSSYNQRRTWDLNYAVLRNIYHARRNHKIDEWHTLCDWIETLPYAKELICG